jgi:UDPglucose 6-dehydrogenase
VVIDKSTVPVGTGDKVRAVIAEELERRSVRVDFAVVSNPEFLKEGAAIADFMRPDRVVIGADDERAILLMRSLYAPFVRNRDRVLLMDVRSAEFTKYAANSMLATRISFMNELSRVAERVGADIEQVRLGIGSDPRIGSQFLYPGIGYGGSCFPKDVKALMRSASEAGVQLQLLAAVEAVNEQQKVVLVNKVVQRLGADLSGKTFALWGLAFKPKTDDMRQAPSLTLVRELSRLGARICAYDPVAAAEAQCELNDVPGFSMAETAEAAMRGADALFIATEWKEFRTPDFEGMRAALKTPLVFDGRNLYEPALMGGFGFEYHSIGRPASQPAAS